MKSLNDLVIDMQNFGLLVSTHSLDTSGKIKRVSTVDKPRHKNGWYVVHIHNSNHINAVFGDYQKNDTPIKWSSYLKLTGSEKNILQAKIWQMEKARSINKEYFLKNIRQFYAAKVSTLKIAHPYIKNKKLDDFIVLPLHDPLSITTDNRLIMPIRNLSGELMGYQSINCDGKKMLAKGSQKLGNFYTISPPGITVSNSQIILIGEGLATMASMYVAALEYYTDMPLCAVVAIDVWNIEPVVRNIISTYKDKAIILVADNDAANEMNIGVETCKSIVAKLQSKQNIKIFIPKA